MQTSWRTCERNSRGRTCAAVLATVVLVVACGDATEPPAPLDLSSLSVTPAGVTLNGSGAKDTVQVVDSAGEAVPAGRVTWFSLNPMVASVDARTGEVQGIASGQAVIGAEINESPVAYAVVTVAVPSDPVTTWAADTLWRPALNAVWGRSDDDVFAVGDQGVILHSDGTVWSPMDVPPGTRGLRDVAGSQAGPVFALDGDHILAYDGAAWTATTTDYAPYRVWVASSTDAFTAGRGPRPAQGEPYVGRVEHWDGAGWNSVLRDSTDGFGNVWGSSATDVFVARSDGAILHFDGTAWSQTEKDNDDSVLSFWGSGPEDVYAGQSSGALRYDGARWSLVYPQSLGVRALAGRGSDDIWGLTQIGKYFLRYDGSEWSTFGWAAPFPGVDIDLNDVWVSATGTVYVVGDDGAVATHAPGAPKLAWTLDRVGTGPDPMTALWGLAWTDVLAAGGRHEIHRRVVDQWTGVSTAPDGGSFVDFWGTASDDLYAVSRRDGLLHWNGSQWEAIPNRNYTELSAVWGASPRDVWVVGPEWRLHYNGEVWVRRSSPGEMLDVWGTAADEVWAVGQSEDQGRVWHRDGNAWLPQATADGTLRAVWGTAPTDVFAVGDGGLVLHYDGAHWTPMATPDSTDLLDVWGTAHSNVYAVGHGEILHFDGSAWSRLEGAPVAPYERVWGSSLGPFYFGADGRVIRGSR